MIRRSTLLLSLTLLLGAAALATAQPAPDDATPSAVETADRAADAVDNVGERAADAVGEAAEQAAEGAAKAANQVPTEDIQGAHEGAAGAHDAHGTAGHGSAHGHHEDPTKTFNFTELMYWGKDRYGGKLGDGVEGPENKPEEPMAAPFVLMLVNFGLLLIILAKFGGPAARKMAETRSDQIKSALEEASALRGKAAAKLAEYEARLGAADAEIAKMVEGMRTDAEAEKQRIAAAAELAAAALKRDAEQRIAAEIERARHELRAEVTAAAIAAAEKILKSKTNAADQQKLFEKFIGDMQQVGAQRANTTPISKERS
jgi:F-type H+-transporting ATPase subunit b